MWQTQQTSRLDFCIISNRSIVEITPPKIGGGFFEFVPVYMIFHIS